MPEIMHSIPESRIRTLSCSVVIPPEFNGNMIDFLKRRIASGMAREITEKMFEFNKIESRTEGPDEIYEAKIQIIVPMTPERSIVGGAYGRS
jgi:hypothetical protein